MTRITIFILCLLSICSCCGIRIASVPAEEEYAVFVDEHANEAMITSGISIQIITIDDVVTLINSMHRRGMLKYQKTNKGISCLSGYGISIGFKDNLKEGESFLCSGYSFFVKKCLQTSYLYGVDSCTRFYIVVSCKELTEVCQDSEVLKPSYIDKTKISGFILDSARGIVEVEKFDIEGVTVRRFTNIKGRIYGSSAVSK
jgi:hypothetical protein